MLKCLTTVLRPAPFPSFACRPLWDIIIIVIYILIVVAIIVWNIFSWLGGNDQFVTIKSTMVAVINLCLGFCEFD